MTYTGLHQLNPVPNPVSGVDLLTLPIFVRGNDNAIITQYDAHDADGSIHLGAGSTATISASNVTAGTFPASGYAFSSALTVAGPLTASGGIVGAALPTFVSVSSIADSTPTATGIVITVPNTNAGGALLLQIAAQSGASTFAAGGAEATVTFSILLPIARTPGTGINSGAATTTGYGSENSDVTGSSAGPLTVGVSLTIAGAVTVTQTATVKINIARAGGNATNHTAKILAQWIPGVVAGGITVAF